ncbi:MAG: FkbM family methyltransferase [Rhodospirillales bacterium]|nr:FkbM family methyltransferase [Rhodospirillales bacterium]
MGNFIFQLIARHYPTERIAASRHVAALWRVLFYLLRPTRPFVMRTPYYRLRVHPERGTLTRAIIRRGNWEAEETRAFAAAIAPGDFVIDVGANFGHYALVAAGVVGAAGLVVAFEPHPAVFPLLADNVALQDHANIVAEKAGLAEQPGTLDITTDLDNPGGHSFVDGNVRTRGAGVAVALRGLDEYLTEKGFADRRLALLKIDVQGFEMRVLRGAAATIARHRPIVFCEVTPDALRVAGDSHQALLEFFASRNYAARPIGHHYGPPKPFAEVARLLETSGREYWDVLFVPAELGESAVQPGEPSPR